MTININNRIATHPLTRAMLGVALLSIAACSEAVADQDPPEAEAEAADPFVGCPQFAPVYSSCEKIDGVLPQFFEAVSIAEASRGYEFSTQLLDGNSMHTEYSTDRVFRLGSDHHTTTDGEPIPDLPSFETSYCEDGSLFRREFTVLPDRQLAEELLEMWVGERGELNFQITTNGEHLLSAACVE